MAFSGNGAATGVRLFVHRLTVPCQNLERRTGLPGLEEALWSDGGLSCEIVQSGIICQGDSVQPLPDSFDPARIHAEGAGILCAAIRAYSGNELIFSQPLSIKSKHLNRAIDCNCNSHQLRDIAFSVAGRPPSITRYECNLGGGTG